MSLQRALHQLCGINHTHESRSNQQNITKLNHTIYFQISDLSMLLQNICNVIPAGIVCFFGSYDFMEQFYKHVNETKALDKIEIKKKVFKEPRSGGASTEKMLMDYGKAIERCSKSTETNAQTGALIMSVIGGKLSEGLNFSDDLGRCVCVVGLPFPNKTSPELVEKMKYLDQEAALKRAAHGYTAEGFTGAEYYENLCMKAVNQSIGRAIRHVNDYAAVLLIDERYNQAAIQRKLPNWIRASLKSPSNFGAVQSALVSFFQNRK